MNLRNAHLEEPLTVTTHTPIIEVAKTLRDRKRRHVYVLDDKEFPVGIVSITDINAMVAEGKNPAHAKAQDVMSTPLHMVELDNDVSKAYFEMMKHDTVALPIVYNGLLVGVLSMNEALRIMVKEKHES